jgi:thymidylate kinase
LSGVKTPFLVSLEGLSGSGKTTLAKKLVAALESTGKSCVYVHDDRHPDRDSISDPDAVDLFYLSSAVQLSRDLSQTTADVVIIDRYIDTMRIYREVREDTEADWIRCFVSAFYSTMLLCLPKPNITLLLVESPTVTIFRSQWRKELKASLEWRRWSAFLEVQQADPDRFVLVTDHTSVSKLVEIICRSL